MNLFSISQLQQYSGIKAHTIRIWEQRYNALTPGRSEGNTRYYDDSQLRRLLNIVSLMDQDYKVSELCTMSDEAMFKLLEKQLETISAVGDPLEYYISQLIASSVTYDEVLFEKIFSNCLLRLGMKDAFVKVMYPMLVRVGLMWSSDSLPTAQEHFISNLLRQKLFAAMDALPLPQKDSGTWVLFLPENEFHEIGLLLSAYLIRLAGRKVIYLGSNVPADSLTNTVAQVDPSDVFFFLVHYDVPEAVQEYVDRVAGFLKGRRLHIAGNAKLLAQLKFKKGANWIQSVEQLDQQLSAN